MLKILQARLQQYMNHGLPDVQAGFRKGMSKISQPSLQDVLFSSRSFMVSVLAFRYLIHFEFIFYMVL